MLCDDLEGWDGRKEGDFRGRGNAYIYIYVYVYIYIYIYINIYTK